MSSQTSKSGRRGNSENGALPLLRGMFICPDPIKNCTVESEDFSISDFFDHQQVDSTVSRFHRILHQRRAESKSEVTDGLFV
jgi:hypothetical protein